ncbi:ATP-binding protein [Tenacibaculum finnmarkense genomovar ulcerans]|uniref:AVAST type 4 anti-phage nuclease Avs4 n=1 Tax=Tenacibaculum finnmarkense TaxID=2781243 RepID=UPI001E413C53|nr:AVAST type 4 anti-phage nuclease Avs4 [Tenacibaculum finnmarkense]MCD8433525.1 ATP-binding protein [Tenacibaculum finnmarkense genomovar ulcerans]
MNWNIFGIKYDKREQWAFEEMSYLIFCAELSNRIGLFRYKNQTGIETEPLEKDGEHYGFQAKYYTVPLSGKKSEIISSIKKAKRENPKLSKILFYLNKEFSESTKKGQKKSKYHIDIESEAKKLKLEIIWRVPSHFELQLSLPENKYIYDVFFNLDPNEGKLLDEIKNHNENILQAIQVEIPFGKKQIKIDRSKIIEEIIKASNKKENVIISGEGGCGKTALFKEFYSLQNKKIPICIFKATELNVNHINELFKFDNDYSFVQFIEAYQNEPTKIFAIDSAEKLAEVTNSDILNTLMQKLNEAGWNIIFTTRYSYLNDLIFHIKENYKLSFIVHDIPLISIDELKSISEDFDFSLPENHKFIERLRNLFYLSDYAQFYPNIDKKGNLRSFIDLLWKKRIQNNLIQKDNLQIERERCIIHIAEKRCATGQFYINAEDLPQAAMFQLKQDEILGYDDTHNGFFITHDIYEEWTLDKIVSRNYANYSDIKDFFVDLGNSLPIRRAFRLWLSDQLSDNSQEIEGFIKEAFSNNSIVQFWKDELLISVLLSDYSESFFKFFENEIIAQEFQILKRILFLLRIACTDISAFDSIDIIKPKGKGWQEVIAFIYKYKTEFFDNSLNLVLPLLTDWCNYNKKGETTKYSGLLALSVIQKTETEQNFYIHDKAEENLLKVVYSAVNEVKLELKETFDKVIKNKWLNNNDPYHGLCLKILVKPYLAKEVIKVLPLSVIELCNLFWQKREKKLNDFGYDRDSIENKYGLIAKHHSFDYFPASSNQTPVNWLLRTTFWDTLNFIINFTNRAIVNFQQTNYDKNDFKEVTLYIDGQEIKQFTSWTLWSLYRGITGPSILQCIHMALEKFLLELSKIVPIEKFKPILIDILRKSKSTSLTSIVCSVVLSKPDKFYDVAIILFKTIELYHLDLSRNSSEFQVKSTCSIGYGLDTTKDILYTDERLKACEDEHRNSHLERLLLNYQLCGVKGFTKEENTEFIEKLYNIIDEHKSNISKFSKSEEDLYTILLARMDRRNLTAKVKEQVDNKLLIEFEPKELSDELREQGKQANIDFEETFKYSFLRSWSDFLIVGRNQNKSSKHEKYDENPLLALSETRQLVDELEKGKRGIKMSDNSIPAFVCSKLIIEHGNKLSKKDKDFCREIILASLSSLFSDDYAYQISDGVEASFHAIPKLIEEFSHEKEDYISIMLMALFDKSSIGNYKRICDYVIESIHESKLWEENPKEAQVILLGYIKLIPIYKSIESEKRKGIGFRRGIPKSSILEEFDKKTTDFNFSKLSFDIADIDLLNIHDLGIVYQLIPSNTKDSIHLEIISKTLPMLASRLLMDRRDYDKEYGDDTKIYVLRNHIFKKLTSFILLRETKEIDIYLKPIIDCFEATEEVASFISEFIVSESKLNKYEQFWYVWNSLYPKFLTISENSRHYRLKEVIINYLLAWRWWSNGEKWDSLKQDNLLLYFNASNDLGHIPSVLYSITRVLNTIGSHFKAEGIDWVYNIVSNNSLLKLDDLESHTLIYLERFMRKFIFADKQKIKKNIRLKNKVIPILDFMIERGSIHGYLLRESIL